jgi:hypothetical protein
MRWSGNWEHNWDGRWSGEESAVYPPIIYAAIVVDNSTTIRHVSREYFATIVEVTHG